MGIPLKAAVASHDPGNFRSVLVERGGRKLHGFVRNGDLGRRRRFFRPGPCRLSLSLFWGVIVEEDLPVRVLEQEGVLLSSILERINQEGATLLVDSGNAGPEVLDWCRASGLDYILGIAPTTTLRRHVEGLEASTKARFEAAPRDGKLRRFMEFFDGAQSWSRVERIIARVEAGAEGPDTRFVVTNLSKRNARRLYEDVYCRRGQAENHIKSWKTHLAADRTSCSKATANQFRLFLHAGAYWLMWGLRVSMPKRSMWRVAQFDTLRLRLIKIAARVVEMKTMIRVHLPTSCPAQDILRFALGRIPRLVT